MDGAGNAWIANIGNYASGSGTASVSEISNSGTIITPSTGYTASGLANTQSIAVDGSGNVWAANIVYPTSSVTEFVGAAAPVVTPTALAVKNNMLGTRP